MKTLKKPRIRDDGSVPEGSPGRPLEALSSIQRRRVRRDLAIVTLRRQDPTIWTIAVLADLFDLGRTRVVVVLKSARESGQEGDRLAS